MSKNKVTIYDVASRLGLSTATVNRVINNKPNVSDKTRKLVLDAVNEMGYRPSKTAASLSRAPIHISVLIAASIADFHNEIERGANAALDELFDFNVRGEVRVIEKRPEADEFIEAMYEEADKDVDAIALVCHKDEPAVIRAMKDISRRGIKFAIGVSEISDQCNTLSVKSNGIVAGKMAAELLENMLGTGKVAIIVGDKGTNVHDDCYLGFKEYVDDSPLELADYYESLEDYEVSASLAGRITDEHPDISGVYISSANSIGFCDQIEKMNKKNDIRIITSDIFPALAQYLDRHVADASIFQNPFLTGKLLVQCIYENLTEIGKFQNKVLYTDPQVVLNSNKELFLNHMKE